MTAPGTSVAVFSSFLDKLKPQLALALPKHLNADRMARLALTAFSASADLQHCTAQSIAASLMTAGQLGLEPGVNGHGYLIPYYDNRNKVMVCTFVPGWKGLVDLVARAGRASVWTGVVYPGDDFDYQLGDAPFCKHRPGDAVADDITGGWTHVYAIGRVRDAQMPVIEVWTRSKVKKHLTTYNKVGERHYANKSEGNFEMYGRKVALLQVLKYMPQSVRGCDRYQDGRHGRNGPRRSARRRPCPVHRRRPGHGRDCKREAGKACVAGLLRRILCA